MSDKQPWEMDWGDALTPPAAVPPAVASAALHPSEMNWGGAEPAAGAQEAPGVAKDVGLSALAGARDAPIAIASGPRGVRDLAVHGLQKLIDLAAPESGVDLDKSINDRLDREIVNGVTPRMILKYSGNPIMGPSFGDISDKVEKAGVPDYDPRTMPGRITKGAVEAVPLALTGNEAAIPSLIKGAALPAVGSEALGDRFAGTWLETPARVAGSVLGTLTGHGGQAATSAMARQSAARDVAGQARTLTGDDAINAGAIKRVAKNIADDQVTPQGAGDTMRGLGNEGMLLDVGRQTQGRAEAIATQPGPGQNRVLDAVENRTGEFGEGTASRVRSTLDTAMGPRVNVVDLKNGIGDIVDKHAKPLYESVMADHPVVNVPSEITSRPAVAQAMKDAVSLAKNYGEKLESPTETQTILKGPGYHIADDTTAPAQTSLRYWDYVKKSMDARINGAMRDGGMQDLNSAEKADLGGLISARNALRDHLDDVTGGAYQTARQVWANKPQLQDALDLGRTALNTKLLPEELAQMHGDLSIPQQAMFRVGMRREVDRIMDTARNDGAAARRLLDTDQNREKIATIFGQGSADAIDRRIAAETKFQNSTNEVAKNSRTAFRQAARKDTEDASVTTPPQASVLGYLHKAGTGVLQGLRDSGMERTRTGIGSLLTTPARNVPDLVRLLSGYNARAAANAAPSARASTSLLARALASQQGQQAQQ